MILFRIQWAFNSLCVYRALFIFMLHVNFNSFMLYHSFYVEMIFFTLNLIQFSDTTNFILFASFRERCQIRSNIDLVQDHFHTASAQDYGFRVYFLIHGSSINHIRK